MAERYMVTTPLNEKYDGKTLGVKFERGRAMVDDVTVDPRLGRDKHYIADQMARDFGYKVEAVSESRLVTVPEMPWKGEAAKSANAKARKPSSEQKD